MEVSPKVGCLPVSSVVGKRPSDPCLHARMPDVSYLCVVSGGGGGGTWTSNGDDDDES